ncbi:MAG: flavodoxin family protein [Clostridiales bacterium]|jgi:multimeric flavodoxin WrbA|uniref:flavodoxin family protein n=1 Tax=Aminipila sp. TaxID=2060095 RepID=UPI001D921276|nr:flavodoxin family protein [Aminipila sp.]MBE6035835.1 flavodoxin family protein [Clostridiales bacterium]
MKKNVLVITGSPRKGGNSDLMADAFIEGAKSAGHIVTKWCSGEKNIEGCRACETCFSTGKACSFDDDFNQLAPLIEKAEVLVLATPVYWFSYPAQIKAAIDKMYSFYMGKRSLKIKESVLLTCAEMDDMSVFDGMKTTYDHIRSFLQWENRGYLAVPSVHAAGDIIGTTALHKARALGSEL